MIAQPSTFETETGSGGVITDSRTDQGRDDFIRDYVIDRMTAAENFDYQFKVAALRHWQLINNIIPEDWPYWSRDFEPETQNAAWHSIEGVMTPFFSKESVCEVEGVEDQDEIATEINRQLMNFVLREWVKYKFTKFFQCQEATFFGNGVEKHLVSALPINKVSRQPQYNQTAFGRQSLGMSKVVDRSMEVRVRSKVVSRFDCYPASTGATIQEMPYFIERCIVPLDTIKAKAKMAGYRNVDKLEGFMAVDRDQGTVRSTMSEKQFDLYERLAQVGFDCRNGDPTASGKNSVKYAELLFYTEGVNDGEGGGRMCLLANREFVIKDWPTNPFDHGMKPYSEIKYSPRSAQVWQAKGVPELMETLQNKLNVRMAQLGDLIELMRDPQMLVGLAAQVQDLSDLGQWPGSRVRVGDVQAIKYQDRPQFPVELFKDIDGTRAGIQRAASDPDYARGIAGSATGLSRGTETAKGLSLLLNAAGQSNSFRWLLSEQMGITDGLNIILALVQQVMTKPQKIKILGEARVLREQGYKDFIMVNPEDIAGRWNCYAVGASRAVDDAQKAQALMTIGEAWKNLPDFAATLDQTKIGLELGELGGIRNPRRFQLSVADQQKKKQEQAQQFQLAQQAYQQQKVLDLIQSVDYKDVPPDIQVQFEQLAGFQPSRFHQADAAIREMVARAIPKPQLVPSRTGQSQ
jgi:hypothetical protein